MTTIAMLITSVETIVVLPPFAMGFLSFLDRFWTSAATQDKQLLPAFHGV